MHIPENCHENVWIFSGTSDGPQLVTRLLGLKYNVFVSVLTYKALAYTACHMALLRSILSYDKSIANNIYQHKRDPNDHEEEDIWGTEN